MKDFEPAKVRKNGTWTTEMTVPAETLFTGVNKTNRNFTRSMQFYIQHIGKVASTNEALFEACAREPLKEGVVYVTRNQYDGKGYDGNIWVSEEGKNLLLSLVLHPHFIKPSEQFVITQIISLSVADLLESLVDECKVRIKWPNDLYLDDRKVCGILVQNSIVGDRLDFSVVGIGLNVNQRQFPDSLPNPVSLAGCTNKRYDPDLVLQDLLQTIAVRYDGFRDKPDRVSLRNEYLNRMYLFEEQAEYKDEKGTFRGAITGVDTYGRLEIRLEDSTKRTYNFKEIEYAGRLYD